MDVLAVIWWLSLSLAVAMAARRRGRGGFAWFVLALVASPLMGGVLLLLFDVRPRSSDGLDDGVVRSALPIRSQTVDETEAARFREAVRRTERV